MTVFLVSVTSEIVQRLSGIQNNSLNKASLWQLQKQEAEQAQTDKSPATAVNVFTHIYPQGRISEHRINLTVYKLNEIVKVDLSGDRAGQLTFLSGKTNHYATGRSIVNTGRHLV